MALTYEERFGGYITDVPRIIFKRCDEKVFYFDELTSCTVTPDVQYTDVNASINWLLWE